MVQGDVFWRLYGMQMFIFCCCEQIVCRVNLFKFVNLSMFVRGQWLLMVVRQLRFGCGIEVGFLQQLFYRLGDLRVRVFLCQVSFKFGDSIFGIMFLVGIGSFQFCYGIRQQLVVFRDFGDSVQLLFCLVLGFYVLLCWGFSDFFWELVRKVEFQIY